MDERETPVRETEYSEPATVRTAKNKNETLMEKCEVCHGSFKKRGLKIHQAKSKSCKKALNRMKYSKSAAGGLPEPHHSDSPRIPKPKDFASNFETPEMSKERDDKEITKETLSQVITRKLKEVRKETDVLVLDDEIEFNIRSSIVQESFSPEAPKKQIKKEKDVLVIDNKHEAAIRSSILQETKTCRVKDVRKKLQKYRYEPEISLSEDERVVEIPKPRKDERVIEIRKKLQKYRFDLDESDEREVEISKPREEDKRLFIHEDTPREDERIVRQVERKHQSRKVGTSTDEKNCYDQKWKDVFRNINGGDQEEVLTKGKFKLTRKDLKTLAGTNLLNDQVMEEYFALLKERITVQYTMHSI